MRSLLFVPADSERKLSRAPQSGADALILDLEDSVVPANQPLARRVWTVSGEIVESEAETFIENHLAAK